MLGFCAENVPEALLGLKTWIPSLGLPRGLLHGLDVDGVAIDAVLETYDGDFRGVYFSVQLNDGEFRQFGVLPTDLFVEEEEW